MYIYSTGGDGSTEPDGTPPHPSASGPLLSELGWRDDRTVHVQHSMARRTDQRQIAQLCLALADQVERDNVVSIDDPGDAVRLGRFEAADFACEAARLRECIHLLLGYERPVPFAATVLTEEDPALYRRVFLILTGFLGRIGGLAVGTNLGYSLCEFLWTMRPRLPHLDVPSSSVVDRPPLVRVDRRKLSSLRRTLDSLRKFGIDLTSDGKTGSR